MQLPKLEVVDVTRKEFRLLDDWELDYSGNTIVIPKGFITDLASVPSPLFFFQWGKWNLPAIIHDWVYLNHFLLFLNPDKTLKIFDLTRAEADLLFYDLLQLSSPRFKKRGFYKEVTKRSKDALLHILFDMIYSSYRIHHIDVADSKLP